MKVLNKFDLSLTPKKDKHCSKNGLPIDEHTDEE